LLEAIWERIEQPSLNRKGGLRHEPERRNPRGDSCMLMWCQFRL